ncbi:MAG: long-chain fatty acid--CoA ligase [Candidatus Solibacter usitatus]|nr:long-chain fatty acid--CoA ligase [Candidatus Solibacter usitatus]
MNPRPIFHLLDEAAARHGEAAALHQQDHTWTWTAYRQAVAEISAGLRSLGYGKGDIIALNSETRAEFYLADLGIMGNGSIAAALYPSYPAADLLRTLAACDAKALFVEDPKVFQALGCAPMKHFFLLTGEAEGAMPLEQLQALGREALAGDAGLAARIRSEIAASDDAILYLTSGATGEPKMAMVSHGAVTTNVDMSPQVLPVGPADRTVAWLPSAHIAQRVVMELLPIRMGMPVWFAESLLKLPQEIKSVRPTVFLAPPRMWERVYTTLCTEINKRPPAVRKLFYGALGLGQKASELRQAGKPVPRYVSIPLALADRLVFRKIRDRFGGLLRHALSGAAPLGKDLAAFYDAIGMPLKEGYGLTEGGVASLNPLERPKTGSIGKPLPGVEIVIAEDGELLLKGPCLFSRYYKDPETTAEVLRDGVLHTGDVAHIDPEGYVFITGRKKELIVSSTGKKIYPSRVENLFKVEPLVSQIVLVGDRLPFLTALFTINTSVAESLKGMEEAKGRPAAEVVAAPPVAEELRKTVKRVNRQLAPFEQIRRYRILTREFTIEDGELTATMKVRRARVMQNFQKDIEELYAGKEENL